MRISPEQVRHVARLAELDVADTELPRLAAELDRIVGYVAQLAELDVDPALQPFIPGPLVAPLRPDVVDPIPLGRPPASLAPEFSEGFFLVPRLAGMEPE